MPLTEHHFDKEGITKNFPLTLGFINNQISKGTFPKPDLIIGRKKYWHRLSIEQFLKVYNKIKSGQSTYTIDYEKRRREYLKKARDFVIKYGIKTPFLYREMISSGYHDAPSPATLFCYSITFEEILGVGSDLDGDCRNIIKLLSEDWTTVKEIAFRLNISERTVYRKIKKIKESGYQIESSYKGIRINTTRKKKATQS